jgi:hypothetical protein
LHFATIVSLLQLVSYERIQYARGRIVQKRRFDRKEGRAQNVYVRESTFKTYGRLELNSSILKLRLEQRKFHKLPNSMGADRQFDSSRLFLCKVEFITDQGPSLGASIGLVFVGLKGTLSILRLPDEALPHDRESHAPQSVLSSAVETEVLSTLPRQERPGAYKEEGAEAFPKTEDLRRLLEHREAAELGHELPLYASEAADYIGISPAELDETVSRGEIPSYPQSYLGEEDRLFDVSDLDEWLATHVNSIAEDASGVPDRAQRGTKDEQS